MSQKTDNLIKLALVFFVSLLSFSIGTYVGKKYSDNQHKLALLEPQKESAPTKKVAEEFDTEAAAENSEQVASQGQENAVEDIIETDKPAALTDSEVAKLAEEFASDEENTEEKIVAQVEPEAVPVATVPAATKPIEKVSATSTVTNTTKPTAPVNMAKNSLPKVNIDQIKPTPTDGEDREPASLPPKQDIVPIHYTVQIGSFPTRDEAESMTKSLQNKGYKTSYVPAKVNGQTWYRVNVGLFGSVREAQDYKREFLEKTKMTSAIVQRVQNQ